MFDAQPSVKKLGFEKMKRGSKRLLFGLLLLIGGFVIFGWTFSALNRGVSLSDQFVASGKVTVNVESAGRFYVWDNYVTWFDGKKIRHASAFPDDVKITVRSASGKSLKFESNTDESWSIGNHAKKSVGYVDIETPDELTFEVTGGNGERVLSFAKADMAGELQEKLGGFGWAALMGVLGLPLVIWGLLVGGKPARSQQST